LTILANIWSSYLTATLVRQLSYSNASWCGFINKQARLTMEHASAVAAETKASSVASQCLKLLRAGVVYE